MTEPVVFISYSHEDEAEKEQVLSHLFVLQRGAKLIELWSDDRIGAGADWHAETNQAIAQARIAILLVSANYLASDFILTEEIPALLQRRNSEGLIIVPVIAKACAWRTVDWLTQMKVRPRDGQPVWREGGSHADDELTKIAEEIAQILDDGTGKFLIPPKEPPPRTRPRPPVPKPPIFAPPRREARPVAPPVTSSGRGSYLGWIVAGGGIVALMVLGALVLFTFFRDGSAPTPLATPTIPTNEITAPPTLTPTTPLIPTPSEPWFGEITFAIGFKDGNPVDEGTHFPKDITEIHAIFEYGSMSQGYTWKRIWYLDGNVVNDNSQEWNIEEAQGLFDAFLDNNAQPLPTGDWRLELYVNDELLQEGSFTIGDK